MKKRGLAWLLAFCMFAGISGCGKQETKQSETQKEMENADGAAQEDESPQLTIDGEQSIEPEPLLQEEKDMLRNGVNQFAYQLYGHLESGENVFFSPYSLCSALSLLNLGAGSETKEELETMLGISDMDMWSSAMQKYLATNWSDETFVLTGNSVWLQQGREWAENMESDFLKPAKEFFESELYEADFWGNPQDAVARINGWADENTNGMIPQVVSELPPETIMILMNAVYFEGKWETPFEEEGTHEETFHGNNGDKRVDMMHQYGEYYAYIESDGMKGIAIPYKDSPLVMKIFIPDTSENPDGGDIEALFAALDDAEKEALLDSLDDADKKEIDRLVIPKFTMEREIEGLTEILRAMGMKEAFEEMADFDKIAADLYVTQVLHKAKIEVDEQGTKAAAVTVVEAAGCAMVEEKIPVVFEADRPFVYVIQDTRTGMILFMGRVNSLE